MDNKSAVDLLNVDYDDVLHLYRGWKRSEGLLLDKNKELAALKGRIKQLQDSHAKFRHQIQALESVKELTVTLQTQVSIFQQENIQLVSENKELSEAKTDLERQLNRAQIETRDTQRRSHDIEVRSENLKGRYEELTKSYGDMEKLASEEQAKRNATETRLKSVEEALEKLQKEHSELNDRLNLTSSQMQHTNKELSDAAKQLNVFSNEVTELSVVRDQLETSEAEKEIIRGDIARLIRLLEHYPAASGFLKRWHDNQGLSFIGPDSSSQKDKQQELSLDDSADMDNDQSIPPLTTAEFAHLKRLHGGNDPFPMSSSPQVRINFHIFLFCIYG